MRVLVIGATGLVGTHVLRALRAAGVDAAGASRRRPAGQPASDWLELDVGDLTAMQQMDFTIIRPSLVKKSGPRWAFPPLAR